MTMTIPRYLCHIDFSSSSVNQNSRLHSEHWHHNLIDRLVGNSSAEPKIGKGTQHS